MKSEMYDFYSFSAFPFFAQQTLQKKSGPKLLDQKQKKIAQKSKPHFCICWNFSKHVIIFRFWPSHFLLFFHLFWPWQNTKAKTNKDKGAEKKPTTKKVLWIICISCVVQRVNARECVACSGWLHFKYI